METKLVDNATDVAVNLAHLGGEISKAKILVEDAIDLGKHKAGRAMKHATMAAEDLVEDTTYYIKRHPWQSVGIAAGLGTTAGLVLGFICAKNCAVKNQS